MSKKHDMRTIDDMVSEPGQFNVSISIFFQMFIDLKFQMNFYLERKVDRIEASYFEYRKHLDKQIF